MRRRARPWSRRVALAALPIVWAACGFSAINDGSDGGGGPLATCTSTKLRGFEPLGGASGSSFHGGVVPAGASMAAVWENATGMMGAGAGQVFLALVDNMGRVAPAQQIASGQDPVVLRADHVAVFWRSGTSLMFQKLNDDGSAIGSPATVYDQIAGDFAADWDGQEFGVVLDGTTADQYEINWLSVAPDGSLLAGPQKLPDGGDNSLLPAMAWTGAYHAVAWTDTRPGTPAIFYARFDGSWTRLAPDQALSPAGMRGSFPTVAAQATGGVVACYQVRVTATNDEVFCSRLDDQGHVTATPQLSMTAYASQDPNVVTHGHATWVLWDEATASGEQSLNWQFLDDSGMPTLAQPFDTMTPGSRPHGAVGPDALYATQYDLQNDGTTNAEVFTINCY